MALENQCMAHTDKNQPNTLQNVLNNAIPSKVREGKFYELRDFLV